MYDDQELEDFGEPSTDQAINLTAALAAVAFPAGLFLCFADQRSRAVHRYAVQSAGLGVVVIAAWMVLWLLVAILGYIPFIGYLFYILGWILGVAVGVLDVVLRVRMAFHAYRGEDHTLPWVGEFLQKFE